MPWLFRGNPTGKLPLLTLAVGLASAGLAACGGGGGSAAAPNSCTTPGVTSDQVVAGLLYPDSGPFSGEFSSFRGGVDARLGAAAEEGDVYGRRLVYKWADDAANATTNLTAAQDLVGREKVFGLMELSPVASGSADWLHQHGIPVTGLAIEPVWSRYDNMFSYTYLVGNDQGITTFGEFAKRHGGTRAAVIMIPANDFLTRIANAFAASLQAAGIPIVDRIEEMPGISDPRTAAARIRASKADVVAGISTEEDFAAVVNLARQQGANVNVVLTGAGYGSPKPNLDWPNGAYAFLAYRPFETGSPAVTRFLSAMNLYAPQIQPATSNVAIHGWLAADMFLRGLHEAGPCPTREAFLRGLRDVKDYDADGLLIQKHDFAKDFGLAALCYGFVQFDAQARSWHPVTGAEDLCGTRITAPAS